jgi:hypothetical protein
MGPEISGRVDQEIDAERMFPAIFNRADEPPEEDPALLERKMMAWCLAMGGKVERKKKEQSS